MRSWRGRTSIEYSRIEAERETLLLRVLPIVGAL